MSHSWNTLVACVLPYDGARGTTLLLLAEHVLSVRYGIRTVRALTNTRTFTNVVAYIELWRIDEIGGAARTSAPQAVHWLVNVLR